MKNAGKLNVGTMFMDADPVVKVIMIGLALASVFTWTILVTIPLLDYLYKRLWLICREKEKGHDYDHLTTDDRDAIRQILLETKRGLPEYWKQPRK